MDKQRKDLIKIIYGALINGEICVGNKLLTERELAEKFQVKRTKLREALISLEALGIIDIRERQGIFIGDAGLEYMTRGLELLSSSPVDILSQVYEVRIILETSIAELAAQRRSERDILLLKEEIDFFNYLYATNHPNKGILGSQHNTILHNLIALAARNTVMQRIYECLSKISENSIAAMGSSGLNFHPFAEWPELLLKEHIDLVEAIVDGDPEKAKKMTIIHLENSRIRNQSANTSLK